MLMMTQLMIVWLLLEKFTVPIVFLIAKIKIM